PDALHSWLPPPKPAAGKCRGSGGSDGGRASGAGRSGGGQCGQNVIPSQNLQGCQEQACRMVRQDGNSTSSAESMHQTCVGGAFNNGAQQLCDRARDLCSRFSSAAQICGRF